MLEPPLTEHPCHRCTLAFLDNVHKVKATEDRGQAQQAGMSKSTSKHMVPGELQKLGTAR